MRKFKDLSFKEKAVYTATLALFPLFLLFKRLGKRFKFFSTRGRQLTASALCAALVLSAVPISAFANPGDAGLYIKTFLFGKNKVQLTGTADDTWSYGTDTAITKTGAEELPVSGWTWALQSNLTTSEYAIKLNGYNGGIICANETVWGSGKCGLDMELSGWNYIKDNYYGIRLGDCNITLHGKGNLAITTTESSTRAIEANSLTVDLPTGKKLTVNASSNRDLYSYGIYANENFRLNSGIVSVAMIGSIPEYEAVGICSGNVTINGGFLTVTATNSGESYGIRGVSKRNSETGEYEYPANVTFNEGSIQISGGTRAIDSMNAPVVSDVLKLYAGKVSDKSDSQLYNPDTFEENIYYYTEHKHCKCGAADTHEETRKCTYYQADNFAPWSDADSLPAYGTYYLTKDVVLKDTWKVTSSIRLCLNGHNITANGDFDVIHITSGDLTLSDCHSTEKQGKITHSADTAGGGIVTDDYTAYKNALSIYGGNICGNITKNGGGIHGGSGSQIWIYGGSITGNIAENGGGIYTKGNVQLNDCSITGNTALYGGGAYVERGNASSSSGDAFRITGGDITNNTATEAGGGVYGSHYVVLKGFYKYDDYSSLYGAFYGNISMNTSGFYGHKKTENITLTDGNALCLYNNFKGGKVYLNLTGEGTLAAIVYPNLTSKFAVYDQTLTTLKCDDSRYSFATDNKAADNKVYLRLALDALSADDFEFTPPTGSLVYNGQPKTAEVKAKSGINCGDITVKYYDENHVQCAAPTKAGTYTVTIDVTESAKYAAAEDLHGENWTFTIAPETVSSDEITITGLESGYIYTGAAIEPVPKVTVDGKELTLNTDYTVAYKNNIAIGKATVTVTLKGNYSGSRDAQFLISYGHASGRMYTLPESSDGWYSGTLEVKAASGYKIGETPDSFSYKLTISGDTARGSRQIFLKAADGKVYSTILQYKIDSEAPQNVKIQYNKSGFKSLLNKITFGKFFKETINVEASAEDSLSGVDEIRYFAAYSVVENVNNISASEWETSLSIAPNAKRFIYVKVTDKAGNSTILLDQGVVAYTLSTVTPTSVTFDLNNKADNIFKMTFNDNTFKELKDGDITLRAPYEYTMGGNEINILANYFTKYSAGTVRKLSFVFYPMDVKDETFTIEVDVTIIDTSHRHNLTRHSASAATCTANGKKAYYSCSGCGELFLDSQGTVPVTEEELVITAINHANAKYYKEEKAACLAAGHKAYWYCGDCQKYFADKNGIDTSVSYSSAAAFEISALKHNFSAKNTADEYLKSKADCNNSAVYYYACENCGEKSSNLTYNYGKALGHLFENYVYNNDATFLADGTKTAHCARGCGADDTITAPDTKLIDNEFPVIDAVDGKTYCGEVTVTVTDKNLDIVTVDGKKVTPDSNGKIKISAKKGEQVITAVDKALNKTTVKITVNAGHTYGEGKVITAPTVEKEGLTSYVCTACSAPFEKTTPKLKPSVVEGDKSSYTRGDSKGLRFKSNALLSDLVSVSVDGNVITAGKDYDTESGSTIVTLRTDYLRTLSVGKHTIDITSVSGTASAEFTITSQQGTSSPVTGDLTVVLWIFAALVIVSVTATEIVFLRKKKR